jgi:hypothetical protein
LRKTSRFADSIQKDTAIFQLLRWLTSLCSARRAACGWQSPFARLSVTNSDSFRPCALNLKKIRIPQGTFCLADYTSQMDCLHSPGHRSAFLDADNKPGIFPCFW